MVPELAGLAADQADQLGGYRISELARPPADASGLTTARFPAAAGVGGDSGMVTAERACTPPRPRRSAAPRAFCADNQRGRARSPRWPRSMATQVARQVGGRLDRRRATGILTHVRAHEKSPCGDGPPPAPVCGRMYWTVARGRTVSRRPWTTGRRGEPPPALARTGHAGRVALGTGRHGDTRRGRGRRGWTRRVAALRAHANQLPCGPARPTPGVGLRA